MKILPAIAAVTVLASCAQSYGVVPMGPDTYSVSVTNAGSVDAGPARTRALREAGTYCAGIGKQVLVKNINTKPGYPGAGSADVVFQCLSSSDPALQRPSYQPAPNVIIQDQRG